MASLNLVTWVWGEKYGEEYVDRLHAGLKRHLKEPFQFLVERPSAEDEHLTKIPGCFCRLRMFDPQWQVDRGIKPGDRIVSIDLDVVITGLLDPLFYRPEPFMILRGANSSNPNPMNGSLWMLRAGYRPDIWSEFSLEAAAKTKHFEFPDDQGWFWDRIPDAPGWNCGPQSGIWSFAKRGWPSDNRLPEGARLVVFPGWRDPSKFQSLPWIQQHWKA